MKLVRVFWLFMLVGFLAACGSVESVPQADEVKLDTQAKRIIRVTTTSGEFNTDGDCSLREAMTAAQKNRRIDACTAGSAITEDVIELQANATYWLTEVDNYADGANGLPSIIGSSSSTSPYLRNRLLIQGNNAVVARQLLSPNFRIFHGNWALKIKDLTIRNGRAEKGGGVLILEDGSSASPLDNVILEGNKATMGGGIYGYNLVLKRVTARNNKAVQGGGIHAGDSNFDQIYATGNEAVEGGGIYTSRGSFSGDIKNSAISENKAQKGAGIFTRNDISIFNTTVSNNIASQQGGGVFTANSLRTYFSTIAYNQGGGISSGAGIMLNNSIVSNNSVPSTGLYKSPILNCVYRKDAYNWKNDYLRYYKESSFSISSDASCAFTTAKGNLKNTDPKLKPLANNGGFAPTHALNLNSPAINAGDPDFETSYYAPYYLLDGRGAARVRFGRVDMGAYEASSFLK